MGVNTASKNPRLVGYARVSTRAQHEDRQVFLLEQYGVKSRNIYIDKMSGKDFNRPAYQRMLSKLSAGDTMIVQSIDRLGRDYDEILEQWRVLTKDMRVRVVVLDMPLLDTGHIEGDELLDTFMADLVLQILSYVAQNEREMMLRRQREGIEAARRKGVRFGRPTMPIPKGFDVLYKAWKRKEISMTKAAKVLGVSHKTFGKWARDRERAGQ